MRTGFERVLNGNGRTVERPVYGNFFLTRTVHVLYVYIIGKHERAYLVVRLARFFYVSIFIYFGCTLFPDIQCLRITFDTIHIRTCNAIALTTNLHIRTIYVYVTVRMSLRLQ